MVAAGSVGGVSSVNYFSRGHTGCRVVASLCFFVFLCFSLFLFVFLWLVCETCNVGSSYSSADSPFHVNFSQAILTQILKQQERLAKQLSAIGAKMAE